VLARLSMSVHTKVGWVVGSFGTKGRTIQVLLAKEGPIR
jgi:hypothetical protein